MKQFLRSFLTLLMLVVWASGFAQSSLSVDFESDLTTYTDWTFKNIAQSATITPHSGTYYGDTSGKTTAYVQTKNKIEAPQQLTFYISKVSRNTTTSNWRIQVSTDGKTWNNVKSVSATSMAKGKWIQVTQNLEKYKNNYVRVYYDGGTATRCIDDITLTVASTKTLTSLAISGNATKKAYNDGDAFDPTGLVVTGTYDDNTTATITNGITWATTPATLTVGTTSCSVTATVNGVTSPAFNVEGLTVTKTITFSIDPATSTVVKAPVKVTLTANAGATIYYTLNGDEPTTTSTKYTAPFEVTTSGTIVKALAVAEGAENATAEATYTIKPEQPVFSDESKTFKDAFDVTLSLPESTDATSTIHYAIGATATAESPLYKGPINISAENDGDKVILRAVVVDPYGNVGQQKYCTYTKTTAIVFDFTANSNAWGIKPQKNNSKDGSNVVAGKELKVSGIVMTATNGDLGTCLYGTTDDYNLRVYKGGSITFTAPEGYNITEITFNGSTKIKSLIPDKGTNNNGTWTGNAHAVKFSNNDSGIEIKTATIKLVASTLPLNETTTAEDAKTLLEANLNKTVNVTINRTLVANKWNTLCLPFDVTAEQIRNILKAEGMVREYKDQTADCINFQAAETMTAGVPYLIKPTEEVKGLTFEGVKITAVEGKTKGGIGSENLAISGILGARKLESFELFLNAAGKFVAPAVGKETMKGFRAYFISLLGAGAKINIDGETTGINSIETEATVNGKVYNLNGQYVGNSLNGLKKGIYVVNGKKVIK